jgi:hypothetical protein
VSKIFPEFSRWQLVMKLDEDARRAEPWKFPPRNPHILTVEEVAGILHCSVDQVRRLPRDQLSPRQGPGKRAIYLHEDIMQLALQLPLRGGRKFTPVALQRVVNSPASQIVPSVSVDLDAALKRVRRMASEP